MGTPQQLEIDILISDGLGTSRQRRVSLVPATIDVPHSLGTGTACVIRTSAEGVSAIHAHLFCDGEFWCLRDNAGLGGTFIDDNRLFLTPIRLEVGQRIRLGIGEGSVQMIVVAGAAHERDGVEVRNEVAGFVKAQKRELKKRPMRWKIALPSFGVLAIAILWGSGAAVVAHRRAALAADPYLAAREQEESMAGKNRLAAIMAGEARPEDVDVAQIVKDASFERTSIIGNAIVSAMKPGTAQNAADLLSAANVVTGVKTIAGAGADEIASMLTPAAPASARSSHGSMTSPLASATVTEASLAKLLDAQRGAMADAAIAQAVEDQSREITLRRLRGMMEKRHRLEALAATTAATRADVAELANLDKRLAGLGIDTRKIHWQPGDDVDKLIQNIDPAVLESVRQKLIAAIGK